MAGPHVVAQTDGGRVRIRTQVETSKRKGVTYRRKIRVEWREPKLLIVYLSDGSLDAIPDHEAYNCANRYRQLASGPPNAGLDFLPHPL